jgi:lipopolysaccharide export system protein LptA
MNFTENIKATYLDSVLYAQKAEYSNSNNNLTISKNVKLEDNRGTMFADKLFFDIKKQTLNVTALENSNVNANIKIK